VGPQVLGVRLDWVPSAAGPVWAVLVVLMAAAAIVTLRSGGERAKPRAGLVLLLIGVCLLHPLYTAIFKSVGYGLTAELVGSAVTCVVAGLVVARVRRASTFGAALIVPVVVWVGLATVYLTALARHSA
jgi:tryptophan-rich sensory protein